MSFRKSPDPVLGDPRSVNAIETIIVPRSVDVGGVDVRRSLPGRDRQMVGPFIFFDQMGPAEFITGHGIDVQPHPHINLATVTYLLQGEMVHRDSLGSEMTIRPGDVNWMRAGRGIVHSERTDAERRRSGQTLFGLQTWVALPEAVEESEPAFMHHGAAELPHIEDGRVSLRLIAGTAHGETSPLETASPTLHADISLADSARFEVEAGYDERALYVLSGRLEVDGSEHGASTMIVLHRGMPVTVSAKGRTRFLLFGGEPMEGPRYIWWNFVSSRPERIEAARQEWARGRFETVPGDEKDFIPAPEMVGKPRRLTGGPRGQMLTDH